MTIVKRLQLVLYDNLPIVILPKHCTANLMLDNCEENEYLTVYLSMAYRDAEGYKKSLFEGYCTLKVVDFSDDSQDYNEAALSDKELLDKLIVIKAEEPLGSCEQPHRAPAPGRLPQPSITFTCNSCSNTNITYKFNALTKIITKNVSKREETSYVYNLNKNPQDIAILMAQNDLLDQEIDWFNNIKNGSLADMCPVPQQALPSASGPHSEARAPGQGVYFSDIVAFPGQSGEVYDEVEIVDIE